MNNRKRTQWTGQNAQHNNFRGWLRIILYTKKASDNVVSNVTSNPYYIQLLRSQRLNDSFMSIDDRMIVYSLAS